MLSADGKSLLSGLSLALSRSDYMALQDISLRVKAFREPVRELLRNAAISDSLDAVPENQAALARVKEQLDATQRALQGYLQTLPGAAPHAAAINAGMSPRLSADKRLPLSLNSPSRSRSSTQGSQDSAASLQYSNLPILRTPGGPRVASCASPLAPATPLLSPNTIEHAIARLWRDTQLLNAPAKPVNEIYLRLGKRHMATLEERVPQIPLRQLTGRGGVPISTVDLVNSLLRSSAVDNEASLLIRHLETIPPGIVACAVANSSAQLFQQLTPDSIKRYARAASHSQQQPSTSARQGSSSALPVLRLLSDHANFLTRLMEMSIMYPIQAVHRARRIEWWSVAACLLRELGDYESLSSLVCVFSSNVIGRLRESWDLVSPQCKAAIRFILERVLKIHPNYSNYREELHLRIKQVQTRRKKRSNTVTSSAGAKDSLGDATTNENDDDSGSLDFDCAVTIGSPDLSSSASEAYVASCVFSKESFDLPPPRALIPIVAVLLKDAVSSEAAGAPPGVDQAAYVAPWTQIIESTANQDLPLPLDSFMLRRIFATELSTHPSLIPPTSQSTPRAIANSLLKRMPRRHSTAIDKSSVRELSLTDCRVLGADQPPHILDLLAHLLFSAAGHPCLNCSVGAPLEDQHMATSGQLAVVVASLLLFAEPWVPCEYLSRLCDMREPRMLPSPHTSKLPLHASLGRSSVAPTANGIINGFETRGTHERPWLMSFKLSDSSDSSRYSKLPPKTNSGNSKHSSIDSVRKTSTDSDSTCVGNRPPSPSLAQPLLRAEPAGRASADMAAGRSSASAPIASNEVRRSQSSQNSASAISTFPVPSTSAGAAPKLPKLPPLPVNAKSPPLPLTEMPTWLPPPTSNTQTLVKSPPMPRSRSLPKDATVAPPPLPAHPMPKFQPSGQRPLSPPLAPSLGPMPLPPLDSMPPLPNALPAAAAATEKKHPERISTEAQMLLNFEARTRHR
ncbi:hypothetical protein GGI02_002036, partial [Coemansia sp. RSA 2322]